MALAQVTMDNFDQEVLASETPVLVKFSAPWCGPCQILNPRLEELQSEVSSVKFVEVDIDEQPQLAQKYTVMSVPTMFFIKGGEIKDQMVGAQPKEAIKEKLDALV